MARLRISEATVKHLYGSATSCAHPDCDAPLIRYSGDPNIPVLNSQIAHIRAASADGPRFDPTMTDDERRQFDNLLLLCHSHHAEVDLPELADLYHVETLTAWRHEQLAGGSHEGVPDEVVERAIELDQLWSLWDFTNATIKHGGDGGQAPGAGGGGGGAIGPNARGGDGGPGGAQYSGTIDALALAGKTAVQIGPGGRPGIYGLPGECAAHTAFGQLVVPGGGRQTHEEESDHHGFAVQVVTATLADNVAVHDGLAYLHRAGWGSYQAGVLPAPFRAGLAVILSVAWSDAPPDVGYPIETIAELLTPSGPATFSVRRQAVFHPPSPEPGSTTLVLGFAVAGTLHEDGVHILHVSCNNTAHFDQALMVTVGGGPSADTSTPSETSP